MRQWGLPEHDVDGESMWHGESVRMTCGVADVVQGTDVGQSPDTSP
jgi:hypothetical protein